jgi:hypothetical protein
MSSSSPQSPPAGFASRCVVIASALLAPLAMVGGVGGCDHGADEWRLDGGDLVTVGKSFASQRQCARCHQGAGANAGELAGSDTPVSGTTAYAPNLTPDVATGLGGWADIEVVRAMRYGVDNAQVRLCRTMPRHDGSDPAVPAMTDLEADAIVAYLKSLPPRRHQVPQSVCPPFKLPPDMAVPDDLAVAPTDDQGAPADDLSRPLDGAGPDGAGPDAAPLDAGGPRG